MFSLFGYAYLIHHIRHFKRLRNFRWGKEFQRTETPEILCDQRPVGRHHLRIDADRISARIQIEFDMNQMRFTRIVGAIEGEV